MNTKQKGDITESRIIFEFTRLGIPVLIPFGDNQRYDLVVEINNEFKKIQCKTGFYKNGCVVFNTCSSQTHRGNGKQSYRGQIDYFAVYCPQLDSCYVCHVDDVNIHEGILRVDKPKNNQVKKIKWAKDYEFHKTFTPSTKVVQRTVNAKGLGSNPRG